MIQIFGHDIDLPVPTQAECVPESARFAMTDTLPANSLFGIFCCRQCSVTWHESEASTCWSCGNPGTLLRELSTTERVGFPSLCSYATMGPSDISHWSTPA